MRTWTAVLLLVVMVVVVATMAEPEPMGFFSRRFRGGTSNNGLLGILAGISGSNQSGFLGGLLNVLQQNGTNSIITLIGQMAGCRFG